MTQLVLADGALPVLRAATLEADVVALRRICHEIGFLYLELDAEDWDCCCAAAAASRRFFARDAATKAEIGYERSPAFRGYMRLGVENTAGVVDRREQVEFGREDGVAVEGPARRLLGPNQWPDDAFEGAAARWLEAMARASAALTSALSVALGLDRDTLHQHILGPKPHWQAKVARYPAGNGQGVGAHTDSGWLTLLWQDGPGLEAMIGGRWTPVPPRDRLSLPYFCNPSLDAVVAAATDAAELDWARPRPDDVAATDSHGAGRNKLHDAYGINAFKSLARSHPAVFARHHPDLVVLPDGTVVEKCWGTLG